MIKTSGKFLVNDEKFNDDIRQKTKDTLQLDKSEINTNELITFVASQAGLGNDVVTITEDFILTGIQYNLSVTAVTGGIAVYLQGITLVRVMIHHAPDSIQGYTSFPNISVKKGDLFELSVGGSSGGESNAILIGYKK